MTRLASREGKPFLRMSVSLAERTGYPTSAVWPLFKDFLDRITPPGCAALAVIHGPPQEPTNLHAHVIVQRTGRSEGVTPTERRRIIRATADLRDDYDLGDPHYRLDSRYTRIERGDDHSFYAWCHLQGVATLRTSCGSLDEVYDRLDALGLHYTYDEHGGTITDVSTDRPWRLRAVAVNLSPNALRASYGDLHPHTPRRDRIQRSYATERHDRYGPDLVARHREEREAWAAQHAAARAAAVRTAREAGTRATHYATAFADYLAGKYNLTIPTDLKETASRATRAMLQGYRARLERVASDAFPPRPERRIGDWLKQLYVGDPVPPATATGVVLDEPKLAQWNAYEGTDLELYDEGLRVGRIDDDRLHLLTLDPPTKSIDELPVKGAAALAIHHAVLSDTSTLQADLRAGEVSRSAPPSPPADVDRALPDDAAWLRAVWQRSMERAALHQRDTLETAEIEETMEQPVLRRKLRRRLPRR